MDQAQQLRNLIRQHQLKERSENVARVITVTSGKGGVGKSNVSVNLAIQLRKMGKRVVILDADFGLANVEVMFGTIPKYTLKDVFEGGKNIKDVLTEGPMGVMFVSGGTGIAGLADLSKEQLNHLTRNLAELDEMADVIIVDTGAGISDSVLEFVAAGSEVLLVATAEPTSLTDSYSLLKALHNYEKFSTDRTTIKVVANKVFTAAEGRSVYTKLSVVCEKFLHMPIFFLGVVPQDEHVLKSVIKQVPVSINAPNAKSSRAYEKLARNLMDEERKKDTNAVGLRGLFANYLKKTF